MLRAGVNSQRNAMVLGTCVCFCLCFIHRLWPTPADETGTPHDRFFVSLEAIMGHPADPCFLLAWTYLKNKNRRNLPNEIAIARGGLSRAALSSICYFRTTVPFTHLRCTVDATWQVVWPVGWVPPVAGSAGAYSYPRIA